jgi:hypothetical protein
VNSARINATSGIGAADPAASDNSPALTPSSCSGTLAADGLGANVDEALTEAAAVIVMTAPLPRLVLAAAAVAANRLAAAVAVPAAGTPERLAASPAAAADAADPVAAALAVAATAVATGAAAECLGVAWFDRPALGRLELLTAVAGRLTDPPQGTAAAIDPAPAIVLDEATFAGAGDGDVVRPAAEAARADIAAAALIIPLTDTLLQAAALATAAAPVHLGRGAAVGVEGAQAEV